MNGFRESFAAAKRLIGGARRILVSGHLSPDGDSLGSMIALARLLRGTRRSQPPTSTRSASSASSKAWRTSCLFACSDGRSASTS